MNLLDRTGELTNKVFDASGVLSINAIGNVMAKLVAVVPGETLHFYCENFDNKYYFRWNQYDADGNFVNRQVNNVSNDFDYTVPVNVCYIWISYPNVGEVSVTRVTAYDAINTKITGGTTA